ncbi:Phosphoribosylaminoimidazole-succinocarboxamide synthase [uncultured archaeon]|nr:Phosphoribosylaminoimidazole-succinocarboxamide synthase [uncultured archaeon]
MVDVVTRTEFSGVPLVARGKVRDIYDLGDKLLLVATDRLSAFDVVLPNGIPYKGAVLNRLSEYWFKQTQNIVPNHLITTDVKKYPAVLQPYASILKDRSMLVKKAKPLPVECVARGYLAGSGWKEYQKSQSVCGNKLPVGLKESSKLPSPIFTPATKAESGHDINISFEETVKILGKDSAERIRDLTLKIYLAASDFAASKGIIIADTKFEFGVFDGRIILIDEVLTPDSSRFWPAAGYVAGRSQKSFDKQFVRDYLETLVWDKTPPGPVLPENVVLETSRKYLEAYRVLTGKSLG